MKVGEIIRLKEDLSEDHLFEVFLHKHGLSLYKGMNLKLIQSKSYYKKKYKWLNSDNLFLIVEIGKTINIENRIYFSLIKVLDPESGSLVYVDKNHFEII